MAHYMARGQQLSPLRQFSFLSSTPSFPSNLHHSDGSPLNPVLVAPEPAILSPATVLLPINAIRAYMSVYALQIIAFAAEFARRQPAHISQGSHFILGRLVEMVVRARIIGAVVAKEVHIAHLELFDAFNFVWIAYCHWVDTLAIAIT